MATAAVTGSLKDIVGESMANRAGKIVFRLNAPNVQTSAGVVGRINPTEPIAVAPNPSNDFFTANLEPTTVMLTDAWYIIEIHWLDARGGVTDFPGWQVRVPPEGGAITNLIVLGSPGGEWGGPIANLSLVLISLTKPDNLQVGQLWLQASPGNHASPDAALNTGKLYRGIA